MKRLFKTPLKACAICIFLTTVALFNGVFVWKAFYQPPWLTYENLPFPVSGEAQEGQVLPLMVKRCNYDSKPHVYPLSHSLELIDSKSPRFFLLESQTVRIEPGCQTVLSLANRLPTNLPPGRYRLFGAAEIQSGLRAYNVEWHSEEFELKK